MRYIHLYDTFGVAGYLGYLQIQLAFYGRAWGACVNVCRRWILCASSNLQHV